MKSISRQVSFTQNENTVAKNRPYQTFIQFIFTSVFHYWHGLDQYSFEALFLQMNVFSVANTYLFSLMRDFFFISHILKRCEADR